MADEQKPGDIAASQTASEIAQDRSAVGSLALEVTTDGGEFPIRMVVYFADPTNENIAIPSRLEEAEALAEVLLGTVDLLKEAKQTSSLLDLPTPGVSH